MYTDGYVQLTDNNLRETPISTTPFPNYINSCSTNNSTNNVGGAIRKVPNTVVVPGFVPYPYLEDAFDDIDNQDKYLIFLSNMILSILGHPDQISSHHIFYNSFCKDLSHYGLNQQTAYIPFHCNALIHSVLNFINKGLSGIPILSGIKDFLSYHLLSLSLGIHSFPFTFIKTKRHRDYFEFQYSRLMESVSYIDFDICKLESWACVLVSTRCCVSEIISEIRSPYEIGSSMERLCSLIKYVVGLEQTISHIKKDMRRIKCIIKTIGEDKYNIKKIYQLSVTIENIKACIKKDGASVRFNDPLQTYGITKLIENMSSTVERLNGLTSSYWFFNYIPFLNILSGRAISQASRISKLKEKMESLKEKVEKVKGMEEYVKNIPACNYVSKRLEYLRNAICYIITEGYLIVCFLKCSNKSVAENTINSTKKLLDSGGQVYNNEFPMSNSDRQYTTKQEKYGNVWSMLSNMALVESKFVTSNLYECVKNSVEIIKTHNWFSYCKCLNYLRDFFLGDLDTSYEMVDLQRFIEHYKGDRYKKNIVLSNEGNHICLCMVIRHILYPNLVRCLGWVIDSDFDVLSTMSRRFEKYTGSYTYCVGKSKGIVFAIVIAEKLVLWMEKKYLKDGIKIEESKVNWCFCFKPDDSYYKYFIGTIIYIRFIVENIFDHLNETTKDSIQALSFLVDEMSSIVPPTKDKCPSSEQQEVVSQSQSVAGSADRLKGKFNRVMSIISITQDSLALGIGILSKTHETSKGSVTQIFKEIKSIISIVQIKGPKFNLFYEKYSALSFKLINSGILNMETKKYIRKTNLFLSNQYILSVRNCGSNGKLCQIYKEGKPCDISCMSKILCISLSLGREKYNLISSQVTNYSILYFLNEESLDIYRIAGDINRITLSTMEIIIKTSKNTRITEETQKILIPDNREETIGVNYKGEVHYNYNDAYRINTSRAQGSLKYIIIKLVLILIILVIAILILGVYPYPNKQTDLPSSYIVL